MNAQDTIPEDIMQAARKACDLCGVTPTSDMRVHAEHVAAQAILAERQRSKLGNQERVRVTDSFGNDLIERELVSIVLRMSRHLQAVQTPAARKFDNGALDYLRRKGLMPSPLRSEETVVQSAPKGGAS